MKVRGMVVLKKLKSNVGQIIYYISHLIKNFY